MSLVAFGFIASALRAGYYWIMNSNDSRYYNSYDAMSVNNAVAYWHNGYDGSSSTLTKLDDKGVTLWQRQISVSNNAGTIAKDASGNYLMSSNGYIVKMDPNANFVGAIYTASYGMLKSFISTNASGDIFFTGRISDNVVGFGKYNSSLGQYWQKGYDPYASCYAVFAAGDSAGNLYGMYKIVDGSNYNGFSVMKYDTSGTITWRKQFYPGNSSNQFRISTKKTIAVDASGNSYVIFGYYPGAAGYTVVMKLDASGNIAWQKRFSIHSAGDYACITLGEDGYIYSYCMDVNANTSVLTKWDSSGNVVWTRSLKGGTSNYPIFQVNLQVDANGAIILSGQQFNSVMMLAKLPADGTKTGSYVSNIGTYTYSVDSTTAYSTSSVASTSAYGAPYNNYGIGSISPTVAATTVAMTRIDIP